MFPQPDVSMDGVHSLNLNAASLWASLMKWLTSPMSNMTPVHVWRVSRYWMSPLVVMKNKEEPVHSSCHICRKSSIIPNNRPALPSNSIFNVFIDAFYLGHAFMSQLVNVFCVILLILEKTGWLSAWIIIFGYFNQQYAELCWGTTRLK